MRIKTSEVVIEDDDGNEIGYIVGDQFRPKVSTSLSAESLEFILGNIRSNNKQAVCSPTEETEVNKPVVRRRQNCRTRTTRLAELLKVIKANGIHSVELRDATGLSQTCISKIICGDTVFPREHNLGLLEMAVDQISEELESIGSGEQAA